jgi:hypothetical protein
MKKMIALAGILAFAAIAVTARAADLSGTWKGSFDFNGDNMPLTLHLTEAEGAVTGTVEGLPTSPAQIEDGKMAGDTVTFWVNTDYQGTTYKLDYTGKVSGDQIAFTFGTDDGSWSAPLTVTRSAETAAPAAADVTGMWKGSFDFDGGSVPLTFHLTETGSAVTGSVEGLPTTPTPIQEGKMDGDTLTFSVQTDYQGETYRLDYTGKVSADKIAFNFGTDDGGWGTTMTATKAQ